MPGFMLSNLPQSVSLHNYDNSRCFPESMRYESWTIKRNTINKFLDDKVFYESEKYLIVLEGVIYNKTELMKKYNQNSWIDTVGEMINSENRLFFNEFDGPFSGAVYNKVSQKWIIFTGPLGEKTVFYYQKNTCFLAGSQLNYITDYLKCNEIEREADYEALSSFLGYGYYLDDSTCLKCVKRLYPGNYLVFDEKYSSIDVCSYYKADYPEEKRYDEEYWIENLNNSFKNAVDKIIKKNNEYHYKTLVDISSGGDSRMIAYTVKALNADNVILDCYAQSGSKDATTSQKIANDLGYSYLYLTLDNAESLMHIDENVLMTNGCTIYYGITGGKIMLETLDRASFGLEITGLLGDVHDGSMVTSYPGEPIDITMKRYRVSNSLEAEKDFSPSLKSTQYFSNSINDHFWFYQRGMMFGMTSYFIRQNFLEVGTPFGDLDFLKIYQSTPWDMRVRKHLLRKWFVKCYPNGAQYEYGDSGLSLKNSVGSFADTYVTARRRVKKLISIALRSDSPKGMNDYNYWYRHNEYFHRYIDDYIRDNLFRSERDEKFRNNVMKMMKTGNVTDKLIVVTALSIIKNYID